ncbi:MAG: hypothetical protein QOE53_1973, partial [Pseudonocardiales bacterium]|nr:hypothetical protein [Pseudonocardiales bacterium]
LFMAGMFAVNMTKAKRVPAANAAAYPAVSSNAPTPTVSTSASPTQAVTPAPTATASSTHAEVSGFPPQVAYTGWTAGHEASIAIAVKADRAVAYLCDGTQVEAWLRGRAQDGVVTLSGKSGNALTGRLSGHTVSGEIRVQGRRLPFSAQLTAPPGGLYTATVAAAQALVTWIVRADGGQTGLQLTDGRAAPAPRLDPTNRLATVAGTTVEAAAVAGDLPPPS